MKTVLIIEDNLEILENISEILELARFRVIVAKNGREGIAAASTESPNIILCDIMMPLVSGYEVLSTLKNNQLTSTIPFIFVTASGEKKEVQAAMDMGANGYLRKPFDSDELVKLINKFVTV